MLGKRQTAHAPPARWNFLERIYLVLQIELREHQSGVLGRQETLRGNQTWILNSCSNCHSCRAVGSFPEPQSLCMSVVSHATCYITALWGRRNMCKHWRGRQTHWQCTVWRLVCHHVPSNLRWSLESINPLGLCLPGVSRETKAVTWNRTPLEPPMAGSPPPRSPFEWV